LSLSKPDFLKNTIKEKKMRIIIQSNAEKVGQWVANYVVDKINASAPTKENPFVLGLPTGSTPIPAYKEIINLHNAGKVSFQNVVTFNMDEYVGIPETQQES